MAPVLVVLILASVVLAQGGATLRWTPKEGDEMKYRTEGTMTVQGIEASLANFCPQPWDA